MSRGILTFDDIEIEKPKLCRHKSPVPRRIY